MSLGTVVVDASVALKWFLRERPDEPNAACAINLLERAATGEIRLLQPPHFIAEVAAVLARLKPEGAQADIRDLQAIEYETLDTPAVYVSAIDLAIRHRQHLFDTLYHAVALHKPGATLITADQRYFAVARSEGRIASLASLA